MQATRDGRDPLRRACSGQCQELAAPRPDTECEEGMEAVRTGVNGTDTRGRDECTDRGGRVLTSRMAIKCVQVDINLLIEAI